MEKQRRWFTRPLCLGIVIMLAGTVLPSLTFDSQGQFLEDNVSEVTFPLGLPIGEYHDLTYSSARGEWVFATSEGLYYHNETTGQWMLEAPDMDARAVAETPWGVAAAGTTSDGGMLVVERDNYDYNSTVEIGDMDVGKVAEVPWETFAFTSEMQDLYQDDFQSGSFSGEWVDMSNTYLEMDGDKSVAAIYVGPGSGIPMSATTNPQTGNTSTLHTGFHEEDVHWTIEYDSMAHTVTKNIGGGGIIPEEDPIMIYDVDGLQNMNNGLGLHYALANDIDASATVGWNDGAGFEPVGNGTDRWFDGMKYHYPNSFKGSLDGRNYTITNLYINRDSTDYVGLFGLIDGGELKNVGLVDNNVIGNEGVGGLVGVSFLGSSVENSFTAGNTSGYLRVGGLIGNNVGTVKYSYTTGTIIGWSKVGGLIGRNTNIVEYSYSLASMTGEWNIGGLVGFNAYQGSIIYSYATGTVTGNERIGGLVGNTEGSEVYDCYATGVVTGNSSVGGLIGIANIDSWSGDVSVVRRSYATGMVIRKESSGSTWFGGFAGYLNQGTITNSYSTGFVTVEDGSLISNGFLGVLVGGSTVQNSFWDTDTSGQANSAGGTGMTTAEMMTQATYSGWSFPGVWWMLDGETRPFLSMEWSTEIRNSHQLQLMHMNLSAEYVLTEDVDLSDILNPASMWGTSPTQGAGFVPVGNTTTSFEGSLDGKNHTLKGLYINRSGVDAVGLFGSAEEFSVENLVLVDTNITAESYVGGLVGHVHGGMVSNVHSTGIVQGNSRVGGLIGSIEGTVQYSYAGGVVTGGGNLGGLVGSNSLGPLYSGYISKSYSDASVTGTSLYLGGLAGENQGVVNNSYSTGNATGSSWYIGGLVGGNTGSGEVNNSYSTGNVSGGTTYVGGLIGSNSGTVSNSFWDLQTSGKSESAGGTGKNTTEMKLFFTFTDTSTEGLDEPWDFTDIWHVVDGLTYPLLQWQPLDLSSAGIDYIRIVDTPDSGHHVIQSGSVLMDVNIPGYAAGFNYTYGYIRDVDAGWSLTTGSSPGYLTLELDVEVYGNMEFFYIRKTDLQGSLMSVNYSLDGEPWITYESVSDLSEEYSLMMFNVDPGSILQVNWSIDGVVGDRVLLEGVLLTGTSFQPGDSVYYLPGEYLHPDVVGGEGVMRVTPVSYSGGVYPTGSLVEAGEEDVGDPLNLFQEGELLIANQPWAASMGWSNRPYAEDLYYNMDSSGTISPGDIRLTGVKAFDFAFGPGAGIVAPLNSLAVSDNYGILAVGDYGALVQYYQNGGDWVFEDVSSPTTNGHNFSTAAHANGVWVVAGVNTTSLEPAAFAFSSSLVYVEEISLPSSMGKIRHAAGSHGIVLLVGDFGTLVEYDASSKTRRTVETGTAQHLNCIGWKWDGSEAVIGGEQGGIFVYHRDSGEVVEVSHLYGGEAIKAVGVKPPYSPGYAWLLRSSSVLEYTFEVSVTMEDSSPQVSGFDMQVGGESRKKGMVDVGSILTFYIDAYFEDGWDDVTIIVEGWHDGGFTGTDSFPPANPGANNRNTYFNISYTSSTGGWALNFPSEPMHEGWDNEFTLGEWSESWEVKPDGYEHHFLSVELGLGFQVRAASPDGGFSFGDETNQIEGLNNQNTWDVRLQIYNSTSITTRYTEFGVYKYVGMSAVGYPTGSAPPSSSSRMYPNTALTVISNSGYNVKIEASDLDGLEYTISASNLEIRNPMAKWDESEIDNRTPFQSAGHALGVWGQEGNLIPPPNFGTTALGPRPGGLLHAGSVVSLSDPDVGLEVYSLENAATNNPGGIYEAGGWAYYIDMDSSGNVTIGDIRISHPTYSSGSAVSSGDDDIGTLLYGWTGAWSTSPDGWHHATDTVYNGTSGIVEGGDNRVTVFYGDTVIEWWINIPIGTPPGIYAGTALVTIQHEVSI